MNAIALPTKHHEAFRYSDVDALARVWPVAEERVVVAEGETLTREIVNVTDAEDVFVRHLAIVLEPRSSCELTVLNAGGRLGRIVIEADLRESASFTLNAVQLGAGDQTVEIVTTIRHLEPDATSRQTVRAVLGGSANGTYLGKVEVAHGAFGTDGSQSVKAMLLDRTATANAVPQLEIFADDVKCAHGCAIGELDAAGLFYLQARGLPPAEAKKLMLQAFVAGVFAEESEIGAMALAKLGELV